MKEINTEGKMIKEELSIQGSENLSSMVKAYIELKTDKLFKAADEMDKSFAEALTDLSWKEKIKQDPWPRYGFPI